MSSLKFRSKYKFIFIICGSLDIIMIRVSVSLDAIYYICVRHQNAETVSVCIEFETYENILNSSDVSRSQEFCRK